jgi:hypothetical protein
MTRVLLIQLPIPHLNFGKMTGNISLGAAYLKQAAAGLSGIRVDIFTESIVSYLGDAALIRYVENLKPQIVGFSGFSWNIERSLYLQDPSLNIRPGLKSLLKKTAGSIKMENLSSSAKSEPRPLTKNWRIHLWPADSAGLKFVRLT